MWRMFRAGGKSPAVIARSEATKQSRVQIGRLDCFVELVIRPATSGRTRWLAMTRCLTTPDAAAPFDARIMEQDQEWLCSMPRNAARRTAKPPLRLSRRWPRLTQFFVARHAGRANI